MEIFLTFLVMLLCLVAEGFFSGSEIGIVSADKMQLRHEAAKGSKGARLALKMLEKPEWLLSTTLVGTNIAIVLNSTVAAGLMISLFGEYGSWLAILLVAPLIWVFGEIVPKSVFQQRANVITPYSIYVLWVCSYLFWPILIVFATLSKFLSKLTGSQEHTTFSLREQIERMVQMPAMEGDIQPREQTMIRRIFDFSETSLHQVMVPLIDVNAVEKGVSVGEAMRFAVERAHVRLPVYEERIDRVIGVVNTLDLLGVEASQPILPYIRPTRYVPLSTNINHLLQELRKDGDAIAVVVDEFGGAEGIVTIEDIVEEVVEDIQDEYDRQEKPSQWMKQIRPREYLVSARADFETFKEQLGLALLPDGQYSTLAGFLLAQAGEIPKTGTVIEVSGYKFSIHRATAQAIQEVRVHW